MRADLTYKGIWQLTYPIMLSLLAENVINITDTIFLGRVGEAELGASAIGGLFYYLLFIVGFGFSLGTQIIISRRNGEKDFAGIGTTFVHSLYFLAVLAIVIMFAVRFSGPEILRKIISSDNVYRCTIDYLNIRIWGLGLACLASVYRAYYAGILRTRYISYSAIIMAIVNVILCWGFVFGKLGLPKMGIAGAALSSVIAEALALVFLYFTTVFNKFSRKHQLYRFVIPKLLVLKKIFKVSFFIMIQHILALGGWWAFFMIVEKSGMHNLAISNIIRTVYIFLMIPIWAYSAAGNTLVSNLMGENRSAEVIGAIKRITLLCFLSTFLLVIIAAAVPVPLLSVFTSDIGLVDDSLISLYIVFGALLLFSVTMTVYGSISGTGNTKPAMFIEIISIICYLFAVWFIALHLKAGIEAAWCCEYVYFLLMGSLSLLYYRYANWTVKKV